MYVPVCLAKGHKSEQESKFAHCSCVAGIYTHKLLYTQVKYV